MADYDDVVHLYCCDENVGLCGADLTGLPDIGYIEKRLCPDCYVLDVRGEPCLDCPPPAKAGQSRR